jgi:S1-C subfamily serine protease
MRSILRAAASARLILVITLTIIAVPTSASIASAAGRSTAAARALPVSADPQAGRSSPAPQGWLGVSLGEDPAPLGQDASTLDGGTASGGVGVLAVVADGPARRAGLRGRDVILSVDGTPVSSGSQLAALVRSYPPDTWINLSIRRGQKTMDLRAFLELRPKNPGSLRLLQGWIGVEAIDLSPDLREHFGAPREAGVMISRVVPGSPAESAGLTVGDVVYEVEGDPIRSGRELAIEIAGGGVDNRLEIRLARDGAKITVEPLIEPRPEKTVEPSDG